MLQIIFKFSYKKSLKNSTNRRILSSFYEKTSITNFNNFIIKNPKFEKIYFGKYFLSKEKRETINCLLKDMLHLIKMWRHIRGYPQGGNTTHTNSNTCKKNKLLFNFRLDQFYAAFGQKKRNIYPTLIKAEYNNRLWHNNWFHEWIQAKYKAYKMAEWGGKFGDFNPAILATNQTNGYKRTGKASKMSKAKVLVKTYTIGVPLFFTRYIYNFNTPRGFPKIVLRDFVNKKLGKKFKRSQLKKR